MTSPVDTDLVVNFTKSKICFVGFASMGDDCGGGVPTFEWAKTFEKLGVSYVLMRDAKCCWYQQGVEGVGDIDDVAGYVAELSLSYDRVVTVGVSMGGYAAILFGLLGMATDIIAMSPQTVIVPGADDRWDAHWRDHMHGHVRYPDLAAILRHYKPWIRIFVGRDGEYAGRDWWHAERVSGAEIVDVEGADHSTVGRVVRDQGFFEALVGMSV